MDIQTYNVSIYMRFMKNITFMDSWKKAGLASQKVRHKKKRKNPRRKSKLEKNRWPIPRLRTDLATGIVFSANCRVPCGAIKPTFAPPILVSLGNKGEDRRRATEMSEYLRKRDWDGPQWRKSRKGTPNPLTMIAVGFLSVPFPGFSRLPLLHHESYRPSTVRVLSNDAGPLAGQRKSQISQKLDRTYLFP